MTYRVLPIVPSDTELPEQFQGVDYHEGWTFEGKDEAQTFADAAEKWAGVAYVDIEEVS